MKKIIVISTKGKNRILSARATEPAEELLGQTKKEQKKNV